MAPQQHLVISWVLSNLGYDKRRDRIVATVCGVIPDIDGLGIIIDKILGDGSYYYYMSWHRKVGHSIVGVLVVAVLAYLICNRKVLPALVAGLTYVTHLLLDLVGSGGPDGDIWGSWLFWPFSEYELSVGWQWGLNSWQNTGITGAFIVMMIMIAAKKRRTVLEVISVRLDRYCIDLISRMFGRQRAG